MQFSLSFANLFVLTFIAMTITETMAAPIADPAFEYELERRGIFGALGSIGRVASTASKELKAASTVSKGVDKGAMTGQNNKPKSVVAGISMATREYEDFDELERRGIFGALGSIGRVASTASKELKGASTVAKGVDKGAVAGNNKPKSVFAGGISMATREFEDFDELERRGIFGALGSIGRVASTASKELKGASTVAKGVDKGAVAGNNKPKSVFAGGISMATREFEDFDELERRGIFGALGSIGRVASTASKELKGASTVAKGVDKGAVAVNNKPKSVFAGGISMATREFELEELEDLS